MVRRQSLVLGYVLFPDEGNGFHLSPNWVRSTVATIDWLRRRLLR